MGMKNYFCILITLASLAACTAVQEPPHSFVDQYRSTFDTAKQNEILVCSNYMCKQTYRFIPTADEASALLEPLQASQTSAGVERQNISKAVAKYENIITKRYNLPEDIPKSMAGAGQKGQLDCIDETVNTTGFLLWLEQQNALKFHKPYNPYKRGHLIDGRWPHYTATIQDIKTKDIYAVDSWFFKTGSNAQVLPIQTWLNSWSPEDESRVQINGTWQPLPTWLQP